VFWSFWFRSRLVICVQVLLAIAIKFGFLGTIICLFNINQSNKDLFVFIVHRSINVKTDKHEGNLGHARRSNNNEACIQELLHVQQAKR